MRVLHVIGGGDTGGAMTHLLPLLSALKTAGCDVHLLCLGGGGLAEEALRRGLPSRVLPMTHAWDPSILAPLRRVLGEGPSGIVSKRAGKGRWDVVHTHGMRANLPVRVIVRSRRKRPCLFTTVHSLLALDYASPVRVRLYEGIDRATLSPVDTVICVSEALRSLLVKRGYPEDRVTVIRSGIELSQGPLPARTPRGRHQRVGTVARLVPAKDIPLMLEIAAELRRAVPESEMVIVGDGPERKRLQSEAEGLGLNGVVRFAGHQADVRQALAEMDVYLVTSLFEGGVSMSVLEAMAAELPVVAVAAGGVTEAVKDGETGIVVPRDRERGALVSELADRVAGLLGDPDLRARMGLAGAQRVRDLFLVEHTAAATLRAYGRCLAARGELA